MAPAQDLIEEALTAAAPESDGCSVIVEDISEVDVRFANNTTTTNGDRRDRRVTVICFRTQPHGGWSAGMARRGGIVDVGALVRAAASDASASPPADDAAPLLTPAEAGDGLSSRRYHEPPDRTDLTVLSGVLRDLSGAFERATGAGHVLYGFAEHRRATDYLGTSTGLRLAHAQPTGALHVVARTPDGDASSWAGVGTPEFDDVSVESLERRVVERLSWSANRIEWLPGRTEVLLPPDAVADLMVDVLYAASGRDAEDGRTVFSASDGGTKIGTALTSTPFSLRSDPAEPGLECAPFLAAAASSSDTSVFDNGLPLGRTDWIDAGRLERLRYHRAGAARSGRVPAPYIDNLVLEVPGAGATLEEMVASTERGLLLTCLWYIREVDPATLLLTGLTRDGVYVVEDGKVVGATTNFRFNESPVDLLARATEVGASVRSLSRESGEYVNRTATPPLRVPDFNMSTVSPAS
ncbi:MAG: TldD/PmbA family protein [Acidimicrobiales bacterium]|nr:TldD/PmbA family protein [Acidimicrobiales bacterium]